MSAFKTRWEDDSKIYKGEVSLKDLNNSFNVLTSMKLIISFVASNYRISKQKKGCFNLLVVLFMELNCMNIYI